MIRIWSDPPGLSFVGKGFLLSAFFVLFFSAARAQEVKTEVSMILESFTSLPEGADVVAPTLKSDSPVAYPAGAAEEGVKGTVQLKMLVAADGSVSESEVIDKGGDQRLLRAAVEGLRRAGFTPGTINGAPAEMWVVVEVVFTATETEADSPEGEEEDYLLLPRDYGVTGSSSDDYLLTSSDWGSEEPTYDPEDIPPLLHYPELARQYGLEGEVRLYVEIDTDGSVLRAIVLSSTSKLFDESALEAVRKLEFLPGMENGQAARKSTEVLVEFRLPEQAKAETMLEAGMDDFIPDATLPAYNGDALYTILEQEAPGLIEGNKIAVSVQIDTDGTILQTVVRSTTNKDLEEPTLRAIRKLTFTPGMQYGRPLRLWVTIVADRSIPAMPAAPEAGVVEEKKP